MKNQHLSLIFILTLFCSSILTGQSQNPSSFGIEIQAYPTGVIPGLRWEKQVSDNGLFHIRVGYQWIRHRDLGEHDDERGNGYGFTLGYTKSISEKFNLGIRNDLWRNTLDWRTDVEGSDPIFGETKVTVLQPTAILEYKTQLSESLIFKPSIAFGLEWNVSTDGEPTGEGPIVLLGFTIATKI